MRRRLIDDQIPDRVHPGRKLRRDDAILRNRDPA